MYDSIPSVADPVNEPGSVDELEESGIRYIFVPITDLIHWEHSGYRRAHTVDTCTAPNGVAMVCMYNHEEWQVSLDTVTRSSRPAGVEAQV